MTRNRILIITIALISLTLIGLIYLLTMKKDTPDATTGEASRIMTRGSTNDTPAPSTTPAIDKFRSGVFTPVGEKTGSGSVRVVTKGDKSLVELGPNFSVQAGPDLYIAFGSNGQVDPATVTTPLTNIAGAQTYTLPDSIDTAAYSQVFIYCKQYSTVFTVADLQ